MSGTEKVRKWDSGVGDEAIWDRGAGTLTFPGQVHGATYSVLDARELSETLWVVAVKKPGRHVYAGQGQRFHYSPAEYVVYHLEDRGSGRMEARKFLAWPVTTRGESA